MRAPLALMWLTTACSTEFTTPEAWPEPEAVPGEADDAASGPASPGVGPESFAVRGRVVASERQPVSAVAYAAEGCLDGEAGGVSGSQTPSSVEVALHRVVLVGDGDTPDAVLFEQADPAAAVATTLGADPVDLGLSQPAEGTYVGIEVSFWSLGLPLAMELDGLPASETTLVRGWMGSTDTITQRDLTVAVEGLLESDGLDDGDYWVELETGMLVATFAIEHPDTGAPDTGWIEPEAPGTRLRMQDDPAFFADDPAELGSGAGGVVSWDVPGGVLTVSEDEATVLDLTFDTTDLLRWWEALDDGDPDTADGVYTVGADCGFHLSPPLLAVAPAE